MNYWKQFAEMLGLELEQEFNLTNADGKKINYASYKITENGLCFKGTTNGAWHSEPSTTVNKLISGYCKAVPKPWKPKFGEQYWSYSLRNNQARCSLFGVYVEDYAIWKSGNCFRTEGEAKTKGKEIMEQIKEEYEEE